LDTANIQEIRDGARLGVISGVTTNHSLASAEGIGDRESYKTAVREIADIIDGPISVEVVSLDVQGMVAEGRDIADWTPNPWVKIPSTLERIEAISVLASEGIKISQTLCFSGPARAKRLNPGTKDAGAGWRFLSGGIQNSAGLANDSPYCPLQTTHGKRSRRWINDQEMR
jgi:TalC/MipB family fructose-6-phosphate aldolase